MISKQRLKELIEQGATIYWNDGYMEIPLNEKCFVEDGKLYWFKKDFVDDDWVFKLEDLFESEEDARWELEMTATRTETLKMPKWEEAQDEKFHFSYLIDVKGLHLFISIYNFTKRFEIYCNHGVHTCDYKFEKTFDLRDKEQYETACKLCLRLFKGEEV